MNNSELIPVFGASFAIYIPLVMLLIALITLFDGYARIIKLLGVEMEDNVTSYNGFTLDSLLWCLRRGGGHQHSAVEADPELDEKLRLGKIIITKELKRLNEPVEADITFSDSASSTGNSLKGNSKGLKEVLMKKYAPVEPDDDYLDERIDASFDEDEDSFASRTDFNSNAFYKSAFSRSTGESTITSPLYKTNASRTNGDLFSISHDNSEKTLYGGRYADV